MQNCIFVVDITHIFNGVYKKVMKTSDYSYVFVIFFFFLHKFIVECILKAKKIV